jgi:hypothetical protein
MRGGSDARGTPSSDDDRRGDARVDPRFVGVAVANVQTLHLLSRATPINDFIDTGPSGPSPGDIYVFSERVFAASVPDQQIGTADRRCVLIDPAASRYDCSITGHFPDGDIMGAGTQVLVEGVTSTYAIVGGTGPYAKARGQARSKLGPFEGPHEVTVELVLLP